MSANGYNIFSEDDECELVAVALGLNKYPCGWAAGGQPCNALVLGKDIGMHLKTIHQANEKSRLRCLWAGCDEELGKGCLVRHVQERHLEWRWPCPRCGTTFTRRGVMDKHRAQCNT